MYGSSFIIDVLMKTNKLPKFISSLVYCILSILIVLLFTQCNESDSDKRHLIDIGKLQGVVGIKDANGERITFEIRHDTGSSQYDKGLVSSYHIFKIIGSILPDSQLLTNEIRNRLIKKVSDQGGQLVSSGNDGIGLSGTSLEFGKPTFLSTLVFEGKGGHRRWTIILSEKDYSESGKRVLAHLIVVSDGV